MRKTYGAKKDANHVELAKAFEKLGACVVDCSGVGGGFPDLVVGLPSSPLVMLVEVKNPNTGYGRRGLNKHQLAFAAAWTGGIRIVRDLDGVVETVNELRRWHMATMEAAST